jgi:hypothetical protein
MYVYGFPHLYGERFWSDDDSRVSPVRGATRDTGERGMSGSPPAEAVVLAAGTRIGLSATVTPGSIVDGDVRDGAEVIP